MFESNLAKILKEKTNVHGCSRTDAGVHAKGFVAHFKTKNPLSDTKIRDALNYYLPQEVVVLSAKTAPASFHARFSAKSKTYVYQIWNHRTRPVFDKAPFVAWMKQRLDVGAMRKTAKHLVVNPSGGLKGCGHPVGATGVKQVVELFEQLRGTNNARQVAGANIGFAHNVGGNGASAVVHIVQRG